jgi:hypothetical protein
MDRIQHRSSWMKEGKNQNVRHVTPLWLFHRWHPLHVFEGAEASTPLADGCSLCLCPSTSSSPSLSPSHLLNLYLRGETLSRDMVDIQCIHDPEVC